MNGTQSTPAQYGVSAVAGAVSAIALTERVVVLAGVGAVASVSDDLAGGKIPSITNATISAGVSVVSGGIIKGGAGVNLVKESLKKGIKVSTDNLIQGLRHTYASETLSSYSNVVVKYAVGGASSNSKTSSNSSNSTNVQSSKNSSSAINSILKQITKTLEKIKKILSR